MFINPRRPKVANTTHMSLALKTHIIMWEALTRLEIGLLQAGIPSFPVGPLRGAGPHRSESGPSFLVPPLPPRSPFPLLQKETQYPKPTEPKEADHWLPLSLRLWPRPFGCAHKLFIFL